MSKSKKSQVLVLFVLAFLLIITPFLPSSFRPTYLYFILNFLIIVLGAEAGLLSAFTRPSEAKKQSASVIMIPAMPPAANPEKRDASSATGGSAVSEHREKMPKVVEKSASEKIVRVTKVHEVERCTSVPSLFFIGGEEPEAEVMEKELEEDEIEGINGQELFVKAEAFIENFYMQLKMQREESWKKIHELSESLLILH